MQESQRSLEEIVSWAQANSHQVGLNQLLVCARELDGTDLELNVMSGLRSVRIAVLSGYTCKPVLDAIRVYCLARKIHVEFFDVGYGRYEAAIRMRDRELERFAPDFVYLMVGKEQVDLRVESDLSRWQELWSSCQDWLGCEVLQNTFVEPCQRVFGHHELKQSQSDTVKIRRLNLQIGEVAPGFVHLVDIDQLSRSLGYQDWYDHRLYDLAKIPVSYDAIPLYAHHVASVIAGAVGKSKKCLVVDLDDTLWGGIVGELGWQGVKMGVGNDSGESFHRLQCYLKELKGRGILLAVCSKNDMEAARQPFELRSDFVLRLEDFSSFYANWDDKVSNLRRIADELSIATDALAFLDDNIVEREFVRSAMPEVGVIELGQDPADFTQLLSSSGIFETTLVTADDRHKTEQYRSQVSRRRLEESVGERSEFLLNLEMRASVRPVQSCDVGRVTQLLNKTTQFNLTGATFTEPQLRHWITEDRFLARCMTLSDRFGDNGTVSAIIGEFQERRFMLHSWVMSCRVIKRDVEFAMFQCVLRDLRRIGIESVHARYCPTSRNRVVADLFPKLGFQFQRGSEQYKDYRLDVPSDPLPCETHAHSISIEADEISQPAVT